MKDGVSEQVAGASEGKYIKFIRLIRWERQFCRFRVMRNSPPAPPHSDQFGSAFGGIVWENLPVMEPMIK